MPTNALYCEAGRILSKCVKGKKGEFDLKNSCFSLSKYSNKRALYALVCESFKNYSILEAVVKSSKILKLEKRLDTLGINGVIACLQHYLVDDNLSSQEDIHQCLDRNKTRLKGEYVKAKIKFHRNEILPSFNHSPPSYRYVRINRLKAPNLDLKEEFTLVSNPKNLELNCYYPDDHISDLFLFSSKMNFTKHPKYLDGSLILQDKSSCMPPLILLAHLLQDELTSINQNDQINEKRDENDHKNNSKINNHKTAGNVIDCCAAPGNKTSQLSYMLSMASKREKKDYKVFAFEKDSKRFQTLVSSMSKHDCHNVTCQNIDFLNVDPKDYSSVKYILVDPSCSGSGMRNSPSSTNNLLNSENDNNDEKRIEIDNETGYGNDDRNENDRLIKLSNFQTLILSHALSFPSVERIVYSTCSIFKEENEMVIERILNNPQFNNKWTLETDVMKDWNERGLPSFSFHQNVIRASRDSSDTCGFFIASLIRKDLN